MSEGNEGNEGEPKAPVRRGMEKLLGLLGDSKEAARKRAEGGEGEAEGGEVSWEEAVEEGINDKPEEVVDDISEQARRAAFNATGVTYAYRTQQEVELKQGDLRRSAGQGADQTDDQNNEGDEGDDK